MESGMVELLAPAADMEALEAALFYGADAVYAGGPCLQLRAQRVGFDMATLEKAIQRVHDAGKKLYVAVNAFAGNDDVDRAGAYAKTLQGMGADAAIVSDLGVFCAMRDAAPQLELHVSTQANCCNYRAAQAYYEMGAKRIVLAREMTLEQIAQLRDRTPPQLTLEAFVHGAMCMAYSGRCMISSFLTGRSGNDGSCAQPCRWNYALMEEKRPGEYFPVCEDEAGTQILSSHDLCMIDHLEALRRAGVTSFKIEGRMKTAYYVATVVNAYRRRMRTPDDAAFCRQELECIRHRPYQTGFYFDALRHGHANDAVERCDCVFAAKVLRYADGMVWLQQRNAFAVGDTLETIARTGQTQRIAVTALFDEAGEACARAPHPMQVLRMPCSVPLAAGELLRKRVEA